MKSNNTIEINGRLYDAKTGKPFAVQALPAAKKPAGHSVQEQKTVDGFGPAKKKPAAASNKSKKATVGPAAPSTPLKAPVAANTRRTKSSRAKLALKHSVTLNRRAVSAPDLTSEPTNQPEVNSSALRHADNKRLQRANSISKSSAVRRFSDPSDAITAVEQPLAKHLEATHKSTSGEPASSTVSTGSQTKERLIKKAMAGTAIKHTGHVKHKAKKAGAIGRYATTSLVVLLLAGYVAYLNIPGISMKVAAHRAGFAANLPGYKPAGYSFKGPITSSPGQVTVNFHSNTDNRQFSLKQQPTTWDSTALLENYVTKQTPNYITYQDRGLTIYIFNGSSAAWVNGGKMYQLEGNKAQLDTEQLLKFATSV